jgi:HEAT repeat protein
LGKRFQAGEKAIADRLVKLLASDAPRMRDGAIRGLAACGTDTVLANLSKITKLLQDPNDFVRITAVAAVSRAAADAETQQAMLAAAVAPPKAVAPNSVRNAIQNPLFGVDTPLAKAPFAAGFDEALVRDSLEGVLTLDPAGKSFLGARVNDWDKDTVVRLADPLVFIAENEQIGDQMFASRSPPAQALLQRLGYREGYASTAYQLGRQAALPRHLRNRVTVIHPRKPLISSVAIKKEPAAFRDAIVTMQTVLIDNPLFSVGEPKGEFVVQVPVAQLLKLVEAAPAAATRPSIADDVKRWFQERLDAAGTPDKKLALCRETLADTARLTTFRKMAAIDFLVEQLGAASLDDLVAALASDDWRVRNHARTHAAKLAAADGGKALAGRFAAAKAPAVRSGILATLGEAHAAAGLPVATGAFADGDAAVRQAAIVAAGRIGGGKMLDPILAHFKQANEADDLRACEQALMALRADAAVADTVRDTLLAALPGAKDPQRESIHWMLGQCGDAPSLAALEKAGATKAADEFRSVVNALSYSPAIEADAVLLRLAKSDKTKAPLVAAESVRRMVLGPKGYGDRTDDQRITFAEQILTLASDGRLIAYLGTTGLPRAMPILVEQLKKGSGGSPESIIANAEAMKDLPPADAKIVAKALQDVMEFIEVTQLRGGAAGKDFREYPAAKALQARAGKALVRFHKPEAVPLPGFKDADLDL